MCMQRAAQNLNETYEATPDSVAHARARLAEFAAAAGAGATKVDAVRLATSEAMTNCVLHAYPGGQGEIHLNAAVVEDELRILISDSGRGLAPRADGPRLGLGLGLGLISQVSDDFTIVSRASGGTEVRIRFNLAEAERASAPPAGAWAGGEPRRHGSTPSMSAA
jgi:stage II sporulation protein AB (anti-sigma F factor)